MKQGELWQSPRYLTLLRGWARDGVSDREIARRMGIKPLTLTLWRKRYPAIGGALSLTGEMTDYQVEDALLKAALGYRCVEEKTEQSDKGDKLVTTEKEVSPSVTAISLWLKRRKPEVWDAADDAGPEETPENNLFQALGNWQEEVLEGDAVQSVQSQAEIDADLVEAEQIPEL